MRLFRSMKYVRSITPRRDGSKVLFADGLKIRAERPQGVKSGDFSAVSKRTARPGTLSIPSEYTFRTVIYAIVVEKH